MYITSDGVRSLAAQALRGCNACMCVRIIISAFDANAKLIGPGISVIDFVIVDAISVLVSGDGSFTILPRGMLLFGSLGSACFKHVSRHGRIRGTIGK